MLHSLKIRNFSSFRGEQNFSLEGPASLTNDPGFVSLERGRAVALSAIIFGANASGKTNFLRAISFLSWFLINSWTALRPSQPFPFLPFYFLETKDHVSEFELQTRAPNGDRFLYSLVLGGNLVVSETLRCKPCGQRLYHNIFTRNGDEYKTYQKSGFKSGDIPKKAIRSNASIISASLQSGVSAFDNFLFSFQITTNVGFTGIIEPDRNMYLDQLDSDPVLKEKVNRIISKCNTGISSLEIAQQELSDQQKYDIVSNIKKFPLLNIDESFFEGSLKIYSADAIHEIGASKFRLPLDLESDGIRHLLPLLVNILKVINNGAILAYDEIEKGLHPQLVQYILDLFHDPQVNTKNAQLICASHAADCLNFLDKYQIFFTSKNEKQESIIYRLSDISGVRNDDNYMMKYLSGAYGGIPEI